MNRLPEVIKSITADGLAVLLGQPPTATISELIGVSYQSWLSQKAYISHKILFEELQKGKQIPTDIDPNSFFGLLHRYLNATRQGAARRNLQLMAQVLRGSLEQDCRFTPDELAANAELVANLSRDEIKFLATIWKSYVNCQMSAPDRHNEGDVHSMVQSQLVPAIYPDKKSFYAAGGALTRTGLIVASSVLGGTRFDLTPRLIQLIELCDLENITEDE